jgi:peptide/nickel transport system substrate-binding protein
MTTVMGGSVGVSRRAFLRWSALSLGLVGLSAACAPAAAPSKPSEAKPGEAAPPAAAKPATAASPGAAAPAAAPAAASAGAPSGKVTLMLGFEPSTLDVGTDSSSQAHIVVRDNVVETLVIFDDQMKIAPGLALSWEMPQPTRTRFKLRPGVKFHNGEPFNSGAVVAAVKRMQDPANNGSLLGFMDTIDKAEAVDDFTVDILTKVPDPILPNRLTYLGIHAPKDAETNPKGPADKPIGTGPYRFVEWVKAQRIALTAYDEYVGERKPTIKDVIFVRRTESNVRLIALQKGEADLIDNIAPEDLGSLSKDQVFTADATECPQLRPNCKGGVTADKRVRQAISYSIDRQALIKEIMGGYANLPNGQVFQPFTFGYDPTMRDYPYDLDKAKALVQEAGAVGKPLTIIGQSAQRWLKDREVHQAVGQMIGKTGLAVDFKFIEVAEYLKAGREITNPPMDIWAVSVGNDFLDPDRPNFGYFKTGGRLALYSNPELDKVLDASRSELDRAKREALLKQISKTVHDDAAAIPLVQPKWIYGLNPKLKFTPLPTAQLPVNRMVLSS